MIVEIFHDVVCPWCWVGKRRFEAAVEQSDVDVEIVWRPFRLDPTIPPGGVDFRTYLQAKFPGMDLDTAHHRLRELGLADGIDFQFDRITRRFDTFDAHRLEALAIAAGDGDAAVEALFSAYFTEGRDLSDRDVLADIAESVGMDRNEVRTALDSDAHKEAALDQLARGLELGISGVPFFVFDERVAISGAQDVDTFVQAITRAAA